MLRVNAPGDTLPKVQKQGEISSQALKDDIIEIPEVDKENELSTLIKNDSPHNLRCGLTQILIPSSSIDLTSFFLMTSMETT